MSREAFQSVSFYDDVIERTGYVQDLIAEDTDESRARIENIQHQLITKATTYDKESENPYAWRIS